MLDLFICFFSAFLEMWENRRLAIQMTILLPDGTSPSRKEILLALKLGETQAKARRVYGLLSKGAQCTVDINEDGSVNVLPL